MPRMAFQLFKIGEATGFCDKYRNRPGYAHNLLVFVGGTPIDYIEGSGWFLPENLDEIIALI
jgi:hypothetical protein